MSALSFRWRLAEVFVKEDPCEGEGRREQAAVPDGRKGIRQNE
jgi:hypothetical protein